MKILIDSQGFVIAYAPHIEFGVFDEATEKWGAFNIEDVETRQALFYVIDHDYTLVEGVELPSDYEDGKYFFENGGFILNENWQPYISEEDKIAKLEVDNSITQNAIMEQQETSAVLEEELLNTQMALADQYETNVLLEEELTSARDEITELQLAICDLYEALI